MNKKIKIILTTMLMITALIFNAKGTYAESLINETIENDDIYWNMQINEINEDVYNEKVRGQTLYEYFNSTQDNMKKIDQENLLFATHTYKVQDGIQNGFISMCVRGSESGAVQGLMKNTLENGQAVFSNKLKNTYQIFPSTNTTTGENEIFKNIHANIKLPIIKNGETYIYSNQNGFYPNVENESFFTVKMQTTFKMTSDGKTNGEDLYFEVGGTDDIYVYVDGKLLIDLGGVHYNTNAKVNFAKGYIFYECLYSDQIEDFEYEVERKIEKISEGDHTITVFYAKRGLEDNTFNMEYNLSNNPIETEKEEENINQNNDEDLNQDENKNNDNELNQNQDNNLTEVKENDENKENKYNQNGGNNQDGNNEEISQNKNDGRKEKRKDTGQKVVENKSKPITDSTMSSNSISNSNKNSNKSNPKNETNIKSKDPKALKSVESTDVKSLNTQNVSLPNEESIQEDLVNRTSNIKEPSSSKINFEDNSESLIMKQINKLSIIHTILIAIVIILQLAILIKK